MEFRLILLLFSGVMIECVSVLHHHHPFVFVNKNMTWKEAQQYCREMYNTDLATIGNMEDVQMMMMTSAKGYSGFAWIGLHQSGEPSWKWSLAEEGSNSLEETGFSDWADGRPSGKDGEECGMMTKEKRWLDVACTSNYQTICYNDASKSYILDKFPSTWWGAQSYCRAHHTDLASVRNVSEYEKIMEMTRDAYYWIGLFRDNWVWSDQSKSSFRDWKGGKPSTSGKDNCAGAWLTDGGSWGDRTCAEKFPFFCRQDQLLLVSVNLTWREAFMDCRERDMYLVNVFTKEIQTLVRKKAKEASTPQVWLGLRFMCPLDIWHWTTRQSVCYTNWAAGGWTGREECGAGREGRAGAVQSGGQQQWVSLPESTRLNFICATEEVL